MIAGRAGPQWHDLVFRRDWANRAVALVANLPLVFLAAMDFRIWARPTGPTPRRGTACEAAHRPERRRRAV